MRKRGHREHQLLAVTSILSRVIMIFIQYERLSITYFCVRCAANRRAARMAPIKSCVLRFARS